MSSPSSIDPYEYLQIIPNPDGTITRNPNQLPNTAANPDPVNDADPVLSKDIPINQSNNTWVRIFLPRQALDHPSNNKLPLIVYYHGGGFILGSAASSLFHDFCSNMAIELTTVVISVEYRLAPEHRLPAAYDDSIEALHMIKTTQDEWLTKYTDISQCFLMGTSAGGNIAYHVGLRASTEVDNLMPLKIKGLILHHPYFGGVKRTESELRLVNDPVLPLSANHLMWDLSLPLGVDRDHEYCNPTVGGGSKVLEQIKLLGWKVLVSGGDGDPLIDRQIELIKLMERKGVELVSHLGVGDYHGVEIMDLSKAKAFCVVLKNFVSSSM